MKKVFLSGSIKELWGVTASLAISYFSMFVMNFVDRVFLAKYSQDALQACSTAGTPAWAIIFAIVTLISMSEVIIAQRNGAGQYRALGSTPWQMVYLTLLVTPFLYFSAPYLAEWLLEPTPYNREWFIWSIYSGPAYFLLAGFTAFYVGQGKSNIIKWLALLGNAVNIVLDYFLIFGYKDIIPSLGVQGAIIATGIGTFVQALILFLIFIQKKNREEFGTKNYLFDKTQFYQILRIGFPPGFFILFEIAGWALFYHMMSALSPLHISTANLVQSILLLFFFFGCALEKGASAIAGNLIGADKKQFLSNLARSGVILSFGYLCFTVITFSACSDLFITNLINEHTISVDIPLLTATVKNVLPLLAVYILFENFRWLLGGILIAAGDTFFMMLSGFFAVWGLLILPTYLFVYVYKADVIYAFWVWLFYSVVATLPIYLRYRSSGWKTRAKLINDTTQSDPTQVELIEIPIETTEEN
ncbi:MAG: MATE family efflux transporter [Chlamydiia bacterium]